MTAKPPGPLKPLKGILEPLYGPLESPEGPLVFSLF